MVCQSYEGISYFFSLHGVKKKGADVWLKILKDQNKQKKNASHKTLYGSQISYMVLKNY